MQQIPFSLPHTHSYRPEDFIRSPANAEAYDWISAWPDWPLPYRGVNIFGPSGCGKTHLSHVFQARAQAVRLDGLKAFRDPGSSGAMHVILDDFDRPGLYDDEAVFHLLNHLSMQGGTALFLSVEAVGRLDVATNDLRSRLRALAAQQIHAPDDQLLTAVLRKKFADRQMAVPDSVIDYMVSHMDRQFAEADRLAQLTDSASLSAKKPVTQALVRQIMDAENNKQNDFDFDTKA